MPTPRQTHPTGTDMAMAFFHLALMYSRLHPPNGPHSSSHSECEVVLSTPSCFGIENLFQAVTKWWEKTQCAQSSSFPSSLSPDFSCRVQGVDFLSQTGGFAAAPPFHTSSTSSGFWTPATDSIQVYTVIPTGERLRTSSLHRVCCFSCRPVPGSSILPLQSMMPQLAGNPYACS